MLLDSYNSLSQHCFTIYRYDMLSNLSVERNYIDLTYLLFCTGLHYFSGFFLLGVLVVLLLLLCLLPYSSISVVFVHLGYLFQFSDGK